MPKSNYYYFKEQEKNKNREGLLGLKKEIKEIYKLSKSTYGYRRITIELNKQEGVKYNHKKIYRLCLEMDLLAKIKRKKYKKYTPGEISENILAQDFYSDEPYRKLVTDITEFRIANVKYYVCPVLDLFNREILAIRISMRANSTFTTRTLRAALRKCKGSKEIIIHSDQGRQFTSSKFKGLIKSRKHIASNSRKGNCFDNAVIENFFSNFKSELIYNKEITSKEMLYKDINDYIYFYNNKRIQIKTKMSPIEVKNNYYKLKNVS